MDDFDATKDVWKGVGEAYAVIRARKAAGGPGWTPDEIRQGDGMSNYRDTSREAWKRFEAISGEIDRGIIDAIRTAAASGITCEAIELQIGRKHQAVSGNLRHLVEKGLVKFSGEYGLTSSGRRAMKWILNMQPEPPKPEPSGAQLSLL